MSFSYKLEGVTVDVADDLTESVGGVPLLDYVALRIRQHGPATLSERAFLLASQNPVSSFKTAVVDIGPTSNNGPGDQMKGIRNWNAAPIKLLAAPGLYKFNHVVVWSLQYKPGTVAYVDPDAPNGQFPSIQFGLTLHAILFGAQIGIADWGLDALDPKVWPSLPVIGANFSTFGGLYGINQSAQ